jgi:hypothetical protein
MSHGRTAASVAVSSLALFGCTALLGSYEVSDSKPGPSETSIGDGPDLVDSEAGGDAIADAAVALLKCSVSGGNARVIDTAQPPPGATGNNGPLRFDRTEIFHTPDGRVRIVSRPTQSPGFRVYDFNPRDGGQQPNKIDVPTNSGYLAAHRLPAGIGVMGLGGPVDPGRMNLYRIADNGFAYVTIPLSAPGTFNDFGVAGSRGPSGDFVQVGMPAVPDFYYSYTAPAPSSGPFELQVGRGNQGNFVGPKVLYSSTDPIDPARAAAMLRAGSQIFMPLDNESNGPPTSSTKMISASDDGAVPMSATARTLAPPGGKVNLFFGGGQSKATPTAVNLGFIEIDTSSTTAPITFRLGAVDGSKLGTFTAADVPVAFSFDTITRLPTDGGNSSWSEDNYLAIGRGQGISGLNFLWYDAAARVLRANQTGPDSILGNRMNIRQAAIAFSGAPVAVFASFDLAWTEETTLMDGSTTESLFYAELSCVR